MRKPKARLTLLDLAEHYIERFKEAGLTRSTYQPFLNTLFKRMATMESGAMKRQLLTQGCEAFLEQETATITDG